mgnify:CR=1 FL=1
MPFPECTYVYGPLSCAIHCVSAGVGRGRPNRSQITPCVTACHQPRGTKRAARCHAGRPSRRAAAVAPPGFWRLLLTTAPRPPPRAPSPAANASVGGPDLATSPPAQRQHHGGGAVALALGFAPKAGAVSALAQRARVGARGEAWRGPLAPRSVWLTRRAGAALLARLSPPGGRSCRPPSRRSTPAPLASRRGGPRVGLGTSADRAGSPPISICAWAQPQPPA